MEEGEGELLNRIKLNWIESNYFISMVKISYILGWELKQKDVLINEQNMLFKKTHHLKNVVSKIKGWIRSISITATGSADRRGPGKNWRTFKSSHIKAERSIAGCWWKWKVETLKTKLILRQNIFGFNDPQLRVFSLNEVYFLNSFIMWCGLKFEISHKFKIKQQM